MKARSSSTARILKELLALAHGLGREDRGLAILGEGNTSARTSSATFAVKASGLNLSSLSSAGLTECRFDVLLPLLEARSTNDEAVERALLAARVDPRARKPSVEAMFHAYLLALPGVRFVGHTHPVAVNGLLCSDSARRFAAGRLFPDEIVCCGEASALVAYTDPGLKLARAIRREVTKFIGRCGRVPRVILLQNHGLIALGSTSEAVLAATLMAEKAARIHAIASAMGGKPRLLSPAHVRRIGGRKDEQERQRILGLCD